MTIVPVQFDPAPLVAGEVDAFASFQTNQPIALAAQGIETVTFLLADYGYNIYADAFFVTEDTLADDEARDTVVALPARDDPRGWRTPSPTRRPRRRSWSTDPAQTSTSTSTSRPPRSRRSCR